MADWTSTDSGYPDPDAPVRVRTADGEHDARMRLFDESEWPDGAYWETDDGRRIELGEVSAWRG